MSRYIIVSLLLFVLVAGAVLVVAEPSQPTAVYNLQRQVISSVAGHPLQNDDYQMVSTGGEVAIGSMSGDGYVATGGYTFPSPSASSQSIYLPIVVR